MNWIKKKCVCVFFASFPRNHNGIPFSRDQTNRRELFRVNAWQDRCCSDFFLAVIKHISFEILFPSFSLYRHFTFHRLQENERRKITSISVDIIILTVKVLFNFINLKARSERVRERERVMSDGFKSYLNNDSDLMIP